jgi:hypothetical protein
METNFHLISFVIGLILGMIIMLLIFWIAYSCRASVFSYCPHNIPKCTGADYYNDPGDALAHFPTLQANQILFLKDEKLYYTRVQKNSKCSPESNQTVVIKYPEYCSFDGVQYEQTFFNSNVYKNGGTITTQGNCIPNSGQGITNGVPLVKWDANPNPVN